MFNVLHKRNRMKEIVTTTLSKIRLAPNAIAVTAKNDKDDNYNSNIIIVMHKS